MPADLVVTCSRCDRWYRGDGPRLGNGAEICDWCVEDLAVALAVDDRPIPYQPRPPLRPVRRRPGRRFRTVGTDSRSLYT